MDLHRRTIRLSEEDIVGMLDLPEGTQVRAVFSQFDPPAIMLGLTNDAWSEVPPDSEAPIVRISAHRIEGGKLRVILEDIPE